MHRASLSIWFAFALCAILNSVPVMSWEFAVTTKNKISFFDDKWLPITTAAHQFNELSAITFDESEEQIYFNDQLHHNGSIFAIKLSRENDGNHITERILSKTRNESIVGMVFDPLEHHLYWTDVHNRKIYRMSILNLTAPPEVIIDFTNGDEMPDGIALDFCRRKVYWTNSNHKNPTIERASLSGKHREILIDSGYMPHGIIVDQYSRRIYWVDDKPGVHYSIESANLDGTDHRVLIAGKNNNPFSLAVTQSHIYWTDLTSNNAIWSIPKNPDNETEPKLVMNFPNQPKGIVTRVGLLQKLENNVDCKEQVKTIKSYLLSPKSVDFAQDKETIRKWRDFCLNNGEYSSVSGECVCKIGFRGRRCDIQDCHNYCVHGTCSLNSDGFPHCICQEGFEGERCQASRCKNYCLNNGLCKIENEEPTCECPDSHNGKRCENNIMETCYLYCKYGQNNTEWNAPPECPETCNEDSLKIFKPRKLAAEQQVCTLRYNLTVIIFAIAGVVIALALALLIIKTIRKIYKPARPRIKKTFVVQKKISQTPLTSRPVATEQCEITIENCCNMNICDTPCFDPKLLQQNLSRDSCKDDKKMLINHMEDDLY